MNEQLISKIKSKKLEIASLYNACNDEESFCELPSKICDVLDCEMDDAEALIGSMMDQDMETDAQLTSIQILDMLFPKSVN